MNDLEQDLEELRIEQEEAEECGDLEERLEIAKLVGSIEEILKSGKPYYWLQCGLCDGNGIQESYEDKWTCPSCNRRGGSWHLK